MNITTKGWNRMLRMACVGLCCALTACSGSLRPKPTEIQGVTVLQEVNRQWTANIGPVDFPLVVSARNDRVALANGQGLVAVLDATTGKEIWRIQLDQKIAAGVGSDGQQVAVVTRNNELVVLQNGQVQWRATLPAQSFTAPLVAGARVFVLTANRSVMAFDGASGRQLWTQQRAGEPLVLKQTGVLLPYKNNLLVGLSGRLLALNSNTGAVLWESALATPRGTNDIERLVDLIGPHDRRGDVVCARAFQSNIGCVNVERGQSVWTRPSIGDKGLSGNETLLIAPLSNGVVQAWNRTTGERIWETERLKYRVLSAPLVTPRGVLLADSGGWLYLMSLADGNLLNRIKLDDDELAAAPVSAAGQYVVISRSGRVTSFQIP